MGVTNHLLTGMMNLQVNPSPLPASLDRSLLVRLRSVAAARALTNRNLPLLMMKGGNKYGWWLKIQKKTPGMYRRTYQNLQPKTTQCFPQRKYIASLPCPIATTIPLRPLERCIFHAAHSMQYVQASRVVDIEFFWPNVAIPLGIEVNDVLSVGQHFPFAANLVSARSCVAFLSVTLHISTVGLRPKYTLVEAIFCKANKCRNLVRKTA